VELTPLLRGLAAHNVVLAAKEPRATARPRQREAAEPGRS
jgi:hypothetical protein